MQMVLFAEENLLIARAYLKGCLDQMLIKTTSSSLKHQKGFLRCNKTTRCHYFEIGYPFI